jgi:hypothetical protein
MNRRGRPTLGDLQADPVGSDAPVSYGPVRLRSSAAHATTYAALRNSSVCVIDPRYSA